MPDVIWGEKKGDVGLPTVLAMAPRLVRNEQRRICDIESRAQVKLAQEVVAAALHISVIELRAPTRRQAPVALARQITMYLLHVCFGFSLSAVGRYCGRDRTTAAHACRQIEDRRDDPAFDNMMDRLEFALHALPVGAVHQ